MLGTARRTLTARNSLEAPFNGVRPIVFAVVFLRSRPQFGRLLGDRFIKPVLEAHAGAASGFLGDMPGLRSNARNVPR